LITVGVPMSFSVFKEMKGKFVKSFLDIVMGMMILENGSLTGYKLMELIYGRFGILIAPSVIYPTLYSMEKQGIVKRIKIARRGGPYTLTEKGKAWILKRLEAIEHLLFEWQQYSISLIECDKDAKPTPSFRRVFRIT